MGHMRPDGASRPRSSKEAIVVRGITTREELVDVLDRGEGYLYNDFGGRDPKMCPIHDVGCASLARMITVKPGYLGVRKLWSDSLPELIGEVRSRNKVYALCGMEPELSVIAEGHAPGDAPLPKLAAPVSAGHPAETQDTTTTGAPLFGVVSAVDGRRVSVWSSYRLQFDSKPATRALKTAIGDAVARLRAIDGEMLEAVYASAQRDLVDAENVLLYNVGTGRFAESSRDGLRFERVYGEPGPPPATISGVALHHHDYRIVRADSTPSHWRRGATLFSVDDVPVPRLDAFSHPDGVWLAMRVHATHVTATHTGLYGLDIRLRTPAGEHIRPADIVKPLVDGLVAGLHEHDGSDLEHLSASVAARVGVAADEVTRLLCKDEGAILGRRRLLWKRAASHQWNPGDDTCVTCTVRGAVGDAAEGWRVDAELFEVAPAT